MFNFIRIIKDIYRKITRLILSNLPYSFIYNTYALLIKIPYLNELIIWVIRRYIPESIRIGDCVFFLDQNDIAVSGSLAFGVFEKFESNLFANSIEAGMNIVDIGAHIGYYSVIAARKTGNDGKVFSFEPENRNYSLLRKNIESNRLDNVVTVKSALSDAAGKRNLYLNQLNRGNNSFLEGELNNIKIVVDTDTLDSFMDNCGNPPINIIKIDVEGAESMVLRGMKRTLERNKKITIFTELSPYTMQCLGESAETYLCDLKSLGFSISIIDENLKELSSLNNIDKLTKDLIRNHKFINIYATRI